MPSKAERIVDRERRYEVEGIRLSYLSSRIFGALAGIEPEADLDGLLARPHAANTLRKLVGYELIDESTRLTKLGERFASRIRRPLPLVSSSSPTIDFGDSRLPRRFWDKTIPEPTTGCWLWIGAHCPKRGYGHFGVNGIVRRAHQVAYIVLRAPIPDGLEIDHKCRTTACVNPWHLEPVTHQVNVQRGWDAVPPERRIFRGVRYQGKAPQ